MDNILHLVGLISRSEQNSIKKLELYFVLRLLITPRAQFIHFNLKIIAVLVVIPDLIIIAWDCEGQIFYARCVVHDTKRLNVFLI
jgi:hypothetical protein